MFESDQHDFDDDFEELGHSAPPPPVAKAPVTPATPVAAAAAVKPPVASVATPAPSAPAAQPAAPAAPAWRPGPPSRPVVAPTSVVRPLASSVALAEPPVEEPQLAEPEASAAEVEEPYEEHQLEFVDPSDHQPAPPPKKKPHVLMFAGAAALVVFTIFVVYTVTRSKDSGPPPGDLGPGIVAVSGLRGHLSTRWEGSAKKGRLAYQLRIEPMEDRWQSGFSQSVLKAPLPMYANVRMLDATGFALCGKEIDFPFDPQNGYVPAVTVPLLDSNGKKLSVTDREAAMQTARQGEVAQLRAAEATREHGKDIFQNQLTNDGEVTALNVQGTLPCSPDQYKQASYWDFNTNFPTLDQQAALLNPKSAAEEAREAGHAGRAGKRAIAKPREGYVIQGDERVKEYDSASGTLFVQGKTFQVDRHSGQVTATEWANNNTLIHYRCDQQSSCALSAAGGTAVLHASLN